MTRFPVVWHFHDDAARARPARELVEHARPDLAYRPFAHRGDTPTSPSEPDVLLVPATLAHTLHGDGRRVIVLQDGAAAVRVPSEAQVVRAPTELLNALAVCVPPSARRRQVVLLVDDEPMVARSLRRALERYLDIRLIDAADNTSGFSAAERERPDLIVTDFARPGGSGREFVEALLEHDELRDTPVIMMSGTARMLGYGPWGDSVGLVAMVEKPFLIQEVAKIVAYALGRTDVPPRTHPPIICTDAPESSWQFEPNVIDPRTLPVNMDWRRRRREYLDARARLRQ